MATEPTADQIKQLREAYLKEIEEKGESGIHPTDLKKIKESDDWLRRFLLHHDNDQKMALTMIKDTCAWRLEQKANDIESVVRKDYLIEGGFFPHNRDKDGCKLFIFKCKKHVKGVRDLDEIKKAVIYWFERLEREENGKPITLFFDMDQCGMSNMDLEFTRFLITIMKEYYPYFLNYIIVLEMAWILNAAFKIIKSWLPEKAKQKIKMLKKAELKEYVPVDQQLTSWGGSDDYNFSFVEPEIVANASPAFVQQSSKKVHFADGSQMSDQSPSAGSGDKDSGSMLSVTPPSVITFVKDGTELVSTLELQNIDSSMALSYKMKTTSPEKFRVRPSAGCLAPGARVTITVNLLPGFQLGGLSRDKFLVTSMPVSSVELSSAELTELWKNANGKDVTQHRLSCTQGLEILKNGNAIPIGTPTSDEHAEISKLASSISNLTDCHKKLHAQVKTTQKLQVALVILMVIIGFFLAHVIRTEFQSRDSALSCMREERMEP